MYCSLIKRHLDLGGMGLGASAMEDSRDRFTMDLLVRELARIFRAFALTKQKITTITVFTVLCVMWSWTNQRLECVE